MADHGLTAAQRKRLPSPDVFMVKVDACGDWRDRARGKTWAQLLADLRSDVPFDVVLGLCCVLRRARDFNAIPCFCGADAVALLSLPLDAWKDAIRAAIEADNG